MSAIATTGSSGVQVGPFSGQAPPSSGIVGLGSCRAASARRYGGSQVSHPRHSGMNKFVAIVSIPIATRQVDGDMIARTSAGSQDVKFQGPFPCPLVAIFGKKHTITTLEPP